MTQRPTTGASAGQARLASPGTASTAVPGLSRAVAVLCLTEIVSWGVLFYAFPVLASSISAEEGWPMVWLVAAFTLALVVSGGCGIWVGRRIDHVGPRVVMTAGVDKGRWKCPAEKD